MASLKIPGKIKKGSGKKGDKSNPSGGGTRQPTKPNNNNNQCKAGSETLQGVGQGKNTLRIESCDKQHATHTTEYVVSTLTYKAQATALSVTEKCPNMYSQACLHYSSANRANQH